jgi:hypothetical protein
MPEYAVSGWASRYGGTGLHRVAEPQDQAVVPEGRVGVVGVGQPGDSVLVAGANRHLVGGERPVGYELRLIHHPLPHHAVNRRLGGVGDLVVVAADEADEPLEFGKVGWVMGWRIEALERTAGAECKGATRTSRR